MVLKVQSHLGHHEAEVAEPEVSEAVFNKLTGKTVEPLPKEMQEKMPDTWRDLEALWTTGNEQFKVFTRDEQRELVLVREYNPEAKDLLFIPIQSGG